MAYIVSILILATLAVLTALAMFGWASFAAYDLYRRTRSDRPGMGWRTAAPARDTRLKDIRMATLLAGTLLGAGLFAAGITAVIAAFGSSAGPWMIVIMALIAAVPGAATGRILGQRYGHVLTTNA